MAQLKKSQKKMQKCVQNKCGLKIGTSKNKKELIAKKKCLETTCVKERDVFVNHFSKMMSRVVKKINNEISKVKKNTNNKQTKSSNLVKKRAKNSRKKPRKKTGKKRGKLS